MTALTLLSDGHHRFDNFNKGLMTFTLFVFDTSEIFSGEEAVFDRVHVFIKCFCTHFDIFQAV